MRILFCTFQRIDEAGGYSRIVMRLGDELRAMGHEVTILGPEELGCEPEYGGGSVGAPYAAALRAHLIAHAAAYDVVEYDHEHLPFPRSDFAKTTLFVVRSVLLVQHFERVRIPERRTLRSLVGAVTRGARRARELRDRIALADVTVRNADLVNLANPLDRDEVVRRGVDPARVAVIPYALATEARDALGAASTAEPPRGDPIVAFIGTFDYRKGAMDFGPLAERILRDVPSARLRLLGSKGLFTDERAIRTFFPRDVRSRVEIVMTFARAELPRLLADVSVGVFPSYVESFGLGALEMMSARVPVVAYDAPGPPVMVPRDLLVAPGDVEAMASRVVALLRDGEQLRRERARALTIAETFTWEAVARSTVEAYVRGRERLT